MLKVTTEEPGLIIALEDADGSTLSIRNHPHYAGYLVAEVAEPGGAKSSVQIRGEEAAVLARRVRRSPAVTGLLRAEEALA